MLMRKGMGHTSKNDVQVGNGQEKMQSERNFHSKN